MKNMTESTQEQLNNQQPDRFQEMLAREQRFKKLVKRAFIGAGILAAVLFIAGFLFFDSGLVTAPVEAAEANADDASTASIGFKGIAKEETVEEDKFDFNMKKFAMDLFDFSEVPSLENIENGIEYVLVDSVSAFEGSMGYSPNVDNSSPFRIVAIGLPAKTLSGTAASCYTGLKLENDALPVDNEQASDTDKTYRVLLPETREVEAAMQEEVDKVISGIVEDAENGICYDEKREDIREASKVRKRMFGTQEEPKTPEGPGKRTEKEPIRSEAAGLSEEKRNKRFKNYLHSKVRYGTI